MEIMFYHPTFDTAWWLNALAKAIPGANIREWKPGDNEPADYALVWHPPVEMLEGRKLKAVFALGAGVDSILSKLKAHPEMLDASIPLFRLEDTTQYAVVEMGMSHLGEIARLVRAARPSAGIITMIGVSHLENLGTRENILKAKMEICQGLPDGAPLVLNADDDLLPTAQIPGRLRPVWFGIRSSSADVRAINIHTVGEGTGFTLVDNVDGETYEFSVTIPTAGVHTVYDALAAYTAATRLGLERARAARALASYQTTGMRQNIVQHGGVTFIEDCYNASPDSMKAALQILHDRQPGPGGRRIAVLGDMLELGAASEPGHRQTGKWAADAADLLVAYGPLSAAMAEAARQKGLQTIHCQAAEEVVEYLRQNVRPGDVVLAKASHAMKLDDVLKQLYAALPNA